MGKLPWIVSVGSMSHKGSIRERQEGCSQGDGVMDAEIGEIWGHVLGKAGSI